MDVNDTERAQMPLEKVFEVFKVLGASLTGITAVFSAAGFLIERARLAMLGLPSTTFDLEQYLETGARFFAFIPVVLSYPLDALRFRLWVALRTSPLLSGLLLVLAIAGGTVLLTRGWSGWRRLGRMKALSVLCDPFHRRSDSPREARFSPGNMKQALSEMWPRIKVLLLVGGFLSFLFFQFWAARQQIQVLGVTDILFASPPDPTRSAAEGRGAAAALPGERARAQIMDWVQEEKRLKAANHFGQLFLFTLITGGILFLVIRWRPPPDGSPTVAGLRGIWITVGALLLVSQVALLLTNYGILMSSVRFPEVCVGFTESATIQAEQLPATQLALIHETDDGFYLYSRDARKMWFIVRDDVTDLVYYGITNVLTDARPDSCNNIINP